MITIIFSRNRAMQLDLCLNSMYLNMEEKDIPTYVLYSCTDERHEKSYEKLKKMHENITFFKENSFKSDLLSLISDKTYILFLVDDNIFVNNFSFKKIADLLDKDEKALGFSLRLGKNTNICFPLGRLQEIPDMNVVEDNIVSFKWCSSNYDFNYPLELSSSIYKKDKIIELLKGLGYENPNSLEFALACSAGLYRTLAPILMSYKTSVAFCNPVNKVQTFNNNRSGKDIKYSPESLLTEFEKCGRINASQFKNFVPNGAHQLVEMEISYEDEKK